MSEEKPLVFKNARIITPMRIIDNGVLIVDHGKISNLGPGDEIKIPKNAKVIDVTGKYLAPGFIDIHLHGGGGADTMDATEEAIEKISAAHVKGGSTSIVLTTTSAPVDDIIRAVKVIELTKKRTLAGAQVLGAHIEGPYFSLEQRGAQNPEYLKSPKPEEYLRLLDECDCILRVSAAPELEGGLELGRELKKRGIVASIAHADATYQDILAAIDAGYTHVTHMYSGMSGLKRINAYRISGAIESTLLLDELTTEVIADGHHMPPSLLKLIIKAKGLDKVSVITDAMSAAGLRPGKYSIGGLDVIVEANVAEEFEIPEEEGNYVVKLLTRDAFAGSVATIDRCVRNMVKLVGLSPQNAVKMATVNPAKVIGVEEKKGSLVEGKNADLVILNEDISVTMTVVGGRIVYENNKEGEKMKAMRKYYETVMDLLKKVKKEEEGNIAEAARLVSEAIEKDRLVHVFGTGGHSYIGAEEMFWRAGGLVPVNPIFDPGISLSHGGTRSSMIERLSSYAKPVLEYYQVKKDDVMIVVNAYGINSVTIDAAIESKKMGTKVIAVTSPSFSKVVPSDHPARHPSKKSLFELEEVDVVVDCHMPPGDAVVEIDGFSQRVAPVSTILNAFVLNSIVACTVENLVKKGITPPVWMSANMPGGDEANKKYIEKYFERIKHL